MTYFNTPLTVELIEDEKLFWEAVLPYIKDEINRSFLSWWGEELKIEDYDMLNGKGAYYELIFGGGAGL